MKKRTQENKKTLTEEDTIHQWIPYAIAGVVFILALIIGILSKDILMVLGSGLPAIAVFLVVRMAFPLPGSEQNSN